MTELYAVLAGVGTLLILGQLFLGQRPQEAAATGNGHAAAAAPPEPLVTVDRTAATG